MNGRSMLRSLCMLLLLLGFSRSLSSQETRSQQTEVSIVGDDFYINGKPTYQGRVWQGHRIEGLLLNSRMVQAIFNDRNPETAIRWAYVDTGKWDAERNVTEFIKAMSLWKSHGLLAVTVNFQGGSPEGYSKTQPWITGSFDPDGTLRKDYADRMRRVLDAADELEWLSLLGTSILVRIRICKMKLL